MKNKHKQLKSASYVVDNYRIPVEHLEIKIKDIADEIILGPQSEILEKIEHFNSKWFKRWDKQKRCYVQDEGVGCTKTFRFKPGTRDRLKHMVANKAFGFDKPGSIASVFSRYSRWTFNHLRDEMADIEYQLRQLRFEGRSWRDNTDEIKVVYDNLKKVLVQVTEKANSLHKDFHFNLFISYDLDHFDEQAEMLNSEMEVDNFQEAKLALIVEWKNHSIQPCKSNNEKLDPIPMGDVIILFEIGFMGWLNLLLKDPLGEVTYSNNYSRRNSSRYSPIVKMGAMCINPINDLSYASSPIVRHPFISSNLSSYIEQTGRLLNQTVFLKSDLLENPNDIEAADRGSYHPHGNSYYHNKPSFTYICMGNGDTAIKTSFVNLNFKELIMNLQLWSYYYIPGTRPLSSLHQSIIGLSSKWSKDFRTVIAQDPDRCKYASFRLAQSEERKRWKKNNPTKEFPYESWNFVEWKDPLDRYDGFNTLRNDSRVKIMLNKFYENSFDTLYDNMADNCDKIKCTLRKDCNAYLSLVEYAIARDNAVPLKEESKEPQALEEVEEVENAIEIEMINWAIAQRRN